MISSRTLKNFVQMHEYKLNAKLNARRAAKQDAELELDKEHWAADCMDNSHSHHTQMTERHQLYRSEIADAHNAKSDHPRSHYFNFILTTTHQ